MEYFSGFKDPAIFFFFFFEGDVMEEDNEVVLNMYRERSPKLERQNRTKNDFQIIR